MTVDFGQAAERLAIQLGDQLPAVWRGTYHAVPRHLFIPDRAWRTADGEPELHPIDRRADAVGWLEAVYSEDIIVTHLDEHGRAASSCSMPYMVFTMLEQADIQPGQKVLEIGTGTGWSSALMASRLGAERVVTVEVDPPFAGEARRNHFRAGACPTVITGDGEQGHPTRAPYDRVIATCAVYRVPYAWIEQTRPGGIILTPLSTPFGPGALARLTVADDGTATGRFVDTAAFMVMVGQQFRPPDEPDDFTVVAGARTVQVKPADLLATDPRFAAGFLVPDCKVAHDYSDDGTIVTVWLLAHDSWASVHKSTTVRQHGPRRLWDEAEAVYHWWIDAGSPAYNRFGITVTPDGQLIWLDDPHRILTVELRSSAAPDT